MIWSSCMHQKFCDKFILGSQVNHVLKMSFLYDIHILYLVLTKVDGKMFVSNWCGKCGKAMLYVALCAQLPKIRPCSHHRFETRTVPEPFQLPVFRPVPLRPLVPERADHLAMWSQWNGSGTVPVGSVVWTVNWTRSGTSPVSEVPSEVRSAHVWPLT